MTTAHRGQSANFLSLPVDVSLSVLPSLTWSPSSTPSPRINCSGACNQRLPLEGCGLLSQLPGWLWLSPCPWSLRLSTWKALTPSTNLWLPAPRSAEVLLCSCSPFSSSCYYKTKTSRDAEPFKHYKIIPCEYMDMDLFNLCAFLEMSMHIFAYRFFLRNANSRQLYSVLPLAFFFFLVNTSPSISACTDLFYFEWSLSVPLMCVYLSIIYLSTYLSIQSPINRHLGCFLPPGLFFATTNNATENILEQTSLWICGDVP